MIVANFPLPWQRCKKGAHLCFENANTLLRHAWLLLENERYAICSCLAIYAIEEIGKGRKLSDLFRTKRDLSESEWKKLSRGKAHITKIEAGQRLIHKHLKKQFPQLQSRKPEREYELAYRRLAEHYQWRKEQYLYVDLMNDDWTFPDMRPTKSEAILSLMVVTEAFEGCIALGRELRRTTTDLEKRYEEFVTLSFRVFAKYFDVPDNE